MKSRVALNRRATRALHYTAVLMVSVGFSFFNMAPNCWGQQTVTVYPGNNLQALVNQYGPSTTFTLTPGIYRLQSVRPQSYDSFVGQPGAILSGAALLTNFTQSSSYWLSQAQVTQAASYPGECGPNPACTLPEDLFFDNVPKTRVISLSGVGPGTWYLDYSTGNVYMGDDPWGHTVEISLLPYAISGYATSVSISGLIVEKYACVGGSGAVSGADASTYWDVSSNEIRLNHGMGIQTGEGMYIHNNYVHTNGELGIGGQGSDIVVQSNDISYNNYAGYTYYNEAGGAKFTESHNLTFRYNFSHDNTGPGFWTDLNCQGILVDSNQFTNNRAAAVVLEISDSATVSNNYIWNDGYNSDGPAIWWGAGILLSDSTNVSVYFNTVSNCMNGIAGVLMSRGYGPNGQLYTLANVDVNSNWITQSTGIAIGICVEGTSFDNSVYTSWNNQFRWNTFNLANPSGQYFYWLGQPMTFAAWEATFAGQ